MNYRHRAYYYLNRLKNRGWTDSQICDQTRITSVRLKTLWLPAAVCTRKEMKKIYSLFRLTPPGELNNALDVWKVENQTPKVEYEGPKITEKQVLILQKLRDSGHKEVMLASTEAQIAGRLVKPGLVKRRVDEDGDSNLRFYSITPLGLRALLVRNG